MQYLSDQTALCKLFCMIIKLKNIYKMYPPLSIYWYYCDFYTTASKTWQNHVRYTLIEICDYNIFFNNKETIKNVYDNKKLKSRCLWRNSIAFTSLHLLAMKRIHWELKINSEFISVPFLSELIRIIRRQVIKENCKIFYFMKLKWFSYEST